MQVIITRTFFAFNLKKVSLNRFSDKGLSLAAVAIFGRYDSKFVLLDGTSSATYIYEQNLLNVSPITFLSDISSLLISKVFGDLSLHILDFPITVLMTFQVFSMLL